MFSKKELVNTVANTVSIWLCYGTLILAGIAIWFMIQHSFTGTFWDYVFFISLIPIGILGRISIPPERLDGIPRLVCTAAWGIACAVTIYVILTILHDVERSISMVLLIGLVVGAVRYYGETCERNRLQS